jgi:hypothetical protein
MSYFGACMQAHILAGNVNRVMNCNNVYELHTHFLGTCYYKIFQYKLSISSLYCFAL